QPALSIAVVAIAVVRGAAEDADFSGVLEPAQDTVVGYVAPEKIPAVPEPGRSFRPARASVQTLDRSVADSVFCEAWVNYFDGGIGIGDGTLPILLAGKRQWLECQSCSCAGGHI